MDPKIRSQVDSIIAQFSGNRRQLNAEEFSRQLEVVCYMLTDFEFRAEAGDADALRVIIKCSLIMKRHESITPRPTDSALLS